MSEFARAHAALFDELERQGIFCVDVGKLTRAVMDAKTKIESAQPRPAFPSAPSPYVRCRSCE